MKIVLRIVKVRSYICDLRSSKGPFQNDIIMREGVTHHDECIAKDLREGEGVAAYGGPYSAILLSLFSYCKRNYFASTLSD